jgi:release factor glutamine methyltransferase
MAGRTLAHLLRTGRAVVSSILRPLFRVFALNVPHVALVGDVRLVIPPGVFPAGMFLSSKMLAEYVRRSPLRDRRVLDMGTGSGVVGIHAEKSGASVTAVDVDRAAVACAAANADRNGCSNFESRYSDLFEQIGENERFDLIVWNPPFYAGEPATGQDRAWFAGSDYAVLRRFSASARQHLHPAGSVTLVTSSDVDLPRFWSVFSDDGWRISVLEVRGGIFVDHLLIGLTG